MNLNISLQSIKNVFRFPFQDPKWGAKFLIGALLGFAGFIIPVVPTLPLLGYLARVLRSGAENADPARLPEWDDWGELFMDGLRQMGVSIVTLFPGAAVMTAGWVFYMGSVMMMPIMENRGGSGPLVAILLISMLVFFLSMAVGMLLMLAGSLLFAPASAHVAVTRRFGALFDITKWFGALRKNWLGFLAALAMFMAIYSVMMFAMQILNMTVVLCMFVPFLLLPMAFYCGLILYRLIGQAYGEAEGRGESEAEPQESAAVPAA